MKKKEKNKEYTYLPAKRSRSFMAMALDSMIVCILTIVLFYAGANPILNANGQNDLIALKDEESDKLTSILNDSHLAAYNDETGVLSTPESLYNVFVYQNIKYCYETYPEIYKDDLDEYGYETKKEFFEDVNEISFDNDYLGYFYTNYIIDKKDLNNENILDINKDNANEYFINEVLDVNKEEGSKFFEIDNNDYSCYPRLNKDVCRYLFQYHLMNISYSTLRDVDNAFYNYFLDRYVEAGDYLLEYEEYANALNNYNSYYEQIQSNLLTGVILTYTVTILIYYFIIPVFVPNKSSFAGFLLKIHRLTDDKKSKIYIYFLTGINSYLHNFFTLLVSTLLTVGVNTLNFHFAELGVFTFNILHIILLSLIINVISIIVFCVRKDGKGLFSLITKTNYYYLIDGVKEENNEKEEEDSTSEPSFDSLLN